MKQGLPILDSAAPNSYGLLHERGATAAFFCPMELPYEFIGYHSPRTVRYLAYRAFKLAVLIAVSDIHYKRASNPIDLPPQLWGPEPPTSLQRRVVIGNSSPHATCDLSSDPGAYY